jgi:cytidylate kinase
MPSSDTAGQGDARTRAARPVRRAFFLSDLHLHGGDPAGVQRAVRFVADARAQDADALFVLGDAFLAWLGAPSLRDAGLAPFLGALADAAAAGVRVVLFHGNHDFLLGPEIEAALGVEVAGDSLDVTLRGQRARLVHGDVFCTRDIAYQRLHRVLRARAVRAGMLALPLSAREAVRDRLLHSSARGTAKKSQATMAMVDEAVVQTLATGPDVIVAGHVHRARDAVFDVGGRPGRLVVMADFESTGSHATWLDGQLRLHPRDARYQHAPGPVIAIDGPAGSGKSSVAAALARRLGFGWLDSGAVYRAVTARVLAAGLRPGTPETAALARGLLMEVEGNGHVSVDGREVPDELLRGPEVSAAVSPVSAQPELRGALMEVQRAAARRFPGLVADGRDMASVVFPDALLSFYLDAPLAVRARRRWEQVGGAAGAPEEVERQIAERDARDRGRPVAPLHVATGARVLDTRDLTLDQVVERLEREVRAALAPQGAVR